MDYRSIIESKYNRKNWQQLLHDIFGQKVQFWAQPKPVDVDKNMAKNALYMGSITLLDGLLIAIYEVELSDNIIIERNRVGIRNLLCTNWRGMGCAGAFMFCFRQNETALRFSYVSETYSFAEDGSLEKDSTDTKRFTYLLGEGHRSRTAIQQFEILKQSALDLKAITKAFSVEAISDEFFKKYKEQYEKFCNFVKENKNDTDFFGFEFAQWEDKSIRDYVKKLLGRIVFLHFIQKKGWLGGDQNYFINLFNNATDEVKDNFLDRVLEPMFFGLLNTKPEERGQLFRKHKWDKSLITQADSIPYLNGGLFEQDPFDKPKSRFPNHFFKELFDFFGEYNFTIDENDPNDAEIGVDPEMLGRIFENLLEDNKDKGAFYTPKEIVQYMCRESLEAYLSDKTDKKAALCQVKICDPAIGSGAFPMGLLNELVRQRVSMKAWATDTNGKLLENDYAALKREIICNNIYGVDIEKGAVDIARLRFWLSLIIDEKTPYALPNLDFKIMQGNSLIESYQGHDLSHVMQLKRNTTNNASITLFEDVVDVSRCQLVKLRNDYYSATTKEEKKSIRTEMRRIVDEQIKSVGGSTFDFGDIDIAETSDFFLWHTWFSDVFDQGGFDIVIGNPPYIKEYTNKSAFDGFREHSPYYKGKMDLWYGFACKSIDMLSKNGILVFIAQNNWTTSEGASIMRNKVVEDTKILQLVDFNTYMIFENADIQTMVMLFQKNNVDDNYNFDYRKIIGNNCQINDIIDFLQKKENPNAEYLTATISRKSKKNKLLTFSNNDTLLDKIAKDKLFFSDEEIAQGIVFPQDFLNKKGQKELGKYHVGDGIFGLTDTELKNLNLSDAEKTLIRPYYTSEQIHKYFTDEGKNTLWMIYTGSEFKNESRMNQYPSIKAHLDKFLDILTSDNKPYGLHRARKESFFNGQKIISLRKCVGNPIFSYSECDCYVTQTFFSIKTNRWNMKFLTGLLNSKLVAFWLKNKGKMQGANFQIDKTPLLQIPLPSTDCEQQPIIALVDKILAAKKENPSADTTDLEKQIDRLVYHLYALTEEEIQIVEGK